MQWRLEVILSTLTVFEIAIKGGGGGGGGYDDRIFWDIDFEQ